MLKLHKKIEYALTALKYMRHKPKNELTTAKEICAKFDVPFDPTSRVLQVMTQHEILKAIQGAYGGYRFEKGLDNVSLYDLCVMIVGPFAITACCEDKALCHRFKKCNLSGAMDKLNKRLINTFKDVSLSEMI